MPKIKCNYYRRAKKMSNSVINVPQNNCETSLLLRSSFPNSKNSTSPLLEDDESHRLSNLSFTQNLSNNGELHDEDSSHSINVNIDRIIMLKILPTIPLESKQ